MIRHRKPPLTFIRSLCSHLPEPEILAAEERFIRFLNIVREIANDLDQSASKSPQQIQHLSKLDKKDES